MITPFLACWHGITAILNSGALGLGQTIFSDTILGSPSTLAPRSQWSLRLTKIKESLKDMSLEELQDMSQNLTNLISVLMTRQVAVEDSILDRLDSVFSK
jgi:hypothetical protein